MTGTDQQDAPPALAQGWGGTGHVTDLERPGLAPVHWVDFGGPTAPGAPSAPPMVLVHGLGGSHLNWVRLAPLLRQDRRVVALDLAGFGFTPGSAQSSTVTSNADLVAEFVRRVVGGPVVLVGNSLGGMVALLTTGAHPDLVERLILIDPAIPTRRRDMDRRVAATFAVYSIPRVGEAFVGQLNARMSDRSRVQDSINLCMADPARADRDAFEAAVRLLAYRREYAPEAEASYLTAARSLLRVLGGRARYTTLMSEIAAPVLLIHGDKDRLVPVAAARTVARDNPGWTSVILPDIGHIPMMEAPEEVAQIVTDWLAR